jgi:hypothetical protein
MSGKTIMKPTREIVEKCELLDWAIDDFLAARNALDRSYQRYEANIEALTLFNLTLRHVEGVITLAQTDLVLLPPAQVAARSVLETSVRAAWLIEPTDPFNREVRYLAHLEDEEKYFHRQIKLGQELGSDVSKDQEWVAGIEKFRRSVASLLAARGFTTKTPVPSFLDCLRSLGEERIYRIYAMLSQTAHGTHAGTWLHRSGGLGTAAIDGEFVSGDDWNIPLAICRFAFITPASIILSRLGMERTDLFAMLRRNH